jgi:hypothetical protein
MWEPGRAIRRLVEKPARSEFNDLPENTCAFHGKGLATDSFLGY